MGAIMYRLAEMDFSDRLGVVVSELAPDDMDPQQETPKAQGAKASDLATADLEMAVFSAP
jgi:hypothetical protein